MFGNAWKWYKGLGIIIPNYLIPSAYNLYTFITWCYILKHNDSNQCKINKLVFSKRHQIEESACINCNVPVLLRFLHNPLNPHAVLPVDVDIPGSFACFQLTSISEQVVNQLRRPPFKMRTRQRRRRWRRRTKYLITWAGMEAMLTEAFSGHQETPRQVFLLSLY